MCCVPLDRQERLNHRFFCSKKLYCFFRREDPDPGKWRCLYSPQPWRFSTWYGVSAPDLLFAHHPTIMPREWAVTRSEFTLAPVYKACLLVRHSGGQGHLIIAIARCTHCSPQRLLTARALHSDCSRHGSPHLSSELSCRVTSLLLSFIKSHNRLPQFKYNSH